MLGAALVALLPTVASFTTIQRIKDRHEAFGGVVQTASYDDIWNLLFRSLGPKSKAFLQDATNILSTAAISGDKELVNRKFSTAFEKYNVTINNQVKDFLAVDLELFKGSFFSGVSALASGGLAMLPKFFLAANIANPISLGIGILSVPFVLYLTARVLKKAVSLLWLREMKQSFYGQSSYVMPDFVTKSLNGLIGEEAAQTFVKDLMKYDVWFVYDKYNFEEKLTFKFVLNNLLQAFKGLRAAQKSSQREPGTGFGELLGIPEIPLEIPKVPSLNLEI